MDTKHDDAYGRLRYLSAACALDLSRWRISQPTVPVLITVSWCIRKKSFIPSRQFSSPPDIPSRVPGPAETDENVPNADSQRLRVSTAGDLIKDLLSTVPAASTRPIIDESVTVTAILEPRVRVYGYHESPTKRWSERKEQRKDLSRRVRSKGDDLAPFSVDRQANKGVSGEVVLRAKHRGNLWPPWQDLYTQERRLDWLSYKKMHSWVQVISTPTVDTPGTSLLLHFDNKRYVVGSLAEGTQRAMMQMGARLLKVSECFITGRTEWRNTGGLIGMILTLADTNASSYAASQEEAKKRALTKAKKLGFSEDEEKLKQLGEEAVRELSSSHGLTLFSPPNLNHTLATARRFVFRKGMPVNVHEISENTHSTIGEEQWAPYWADDNIKVWAISVLPCEKGTTTEEAVTGKGAMSPRKRSIDEVYRPEQAPNGSTSRGAVTAIVADELTPKERDQLTVKAVVGEMFNSAWRLDTLYETPLSEVRLPATVFIRNAETHKIERYTGPFPGDAKDSEAAADPKVLVRRPWPGAMVESLPPTEPAMQAVSYIIRNHRQRGKFRPDLAKALKIEDVTKYKRLTAGLSVENTEGEMITPEMVMEESKEGGGIAVVDLPERGYIEPLLARAEWREPKVMAGVGAVVWICGDGVANDERLHTFMREFKHLRHVISARDQCPNNIALDSTATSTIRLKQVDPKRYVVPVHDNTPPTGFNALPEGVYSAARGLTVQLEPTIEVRDKQLVPSLDVAAVEAETASDVLVEATKAQEAVEGDRASTEKWASTLPPGARDVEIVTLGTGSASPSKYRNVSATLMIVPSWGNVLFDAGENTLGQLKRVFAADELAQVFRDLKILSISHMHADHHLGTVGVIREWYKTVHDAKPLPVGADLRSTFPENGGLAVMAEPAMQHWLYEYAAVEDYGYSRIAPVSVQVKGYRPATIGWFMPTHELADLSLAETTEKFEAAALSPSFLNLSDVQACNVKHCHGARAVSLTFLSGFKASYSGDCRPSRAFERIGKGSTVVIHEATFDDELLGDAMVKNHSTTSEALTVAQNMGARACVLTHFSQRYQKLPVLEHTVALDEAQRHHMDDLNMDVSAEDPINPEAEDMETLEGADEMAITLPDQVASDGTATHNVDLPSQAAPNISGEGSAASSAIKFKLSTDMKVCVAFDYMRVKVGEMPEMEKFTPALLKLFAVVEKPEAVVDEGGGKVKEKKQKKQKQKGDGGRMVDEVKRPNKHSTDAV